MSPGAFASTFKRLENTAKIGFEIEVFVPHGTFFYAAPDIAEPKQIQLKELSTYSQVAEYFKISDSEFNRMRTDYADWTAEQEALWVEDHWEDFITDHEARAARKDARALALRNTKGRFNWTDWVSTEFKTISGLVTALALIPKYGWTPDCTGIFIEPAQISGYMSGFNNTAKHMAEKLKDVLKQVVTVHGIGYTNWNLTHDTSIKDNEGRSDEEGQAGYGVEIISPPKPPSIALKELAIVFDVLKKYEVHTNESTSIHINVSLENLEDLDPMKLVLFMGDEYILKKFNRTANVFSLSQIRTILDSISLTGTVPKDINTVMELGREGLEKTGKYFSVNLQHLPKYLEFRAAGGMNYHTRLNDIHETAGRWLTAVEIASTPDRCRNEYLKKIIKLVNTTSEYELLNPG